MCTIDKFDDMESFIRYKIEVENCSQKELSALLQQSFPGMKGLSVRSLQRFCSSQDIHRTSRLEEDELDQVVEESVNQVGPTYGRKTMTGFLRAKCIRVSEMRVGKSLGRVNLPYHQARQNATARQTNPVPYKAHYFGEKLHVDQNEKLVKFGVTHIAAIDGYSRMIVGFCTMSIKNTVEVYRRLYRPITLEHGLFDQIRVDHGREWYLVLAVQQQLSPLRLCQDRVPYLQTTSKMNHPVERIWVEVNSRVNYPIKSCLIHMEENNMINMDDDHHKYLTSHFAINVSSVGTSYVVESWNKHSIPGRGIPEDNMTRNNQASKIPPDVLLSPEEAVQAYNSAGGNLTEFSEFGRDPLQSNAYLVAQRESTFLGRHDYNNIFNKLVNGNTLPFISGLIDLINISETLVITM